MTLNEYKNYLIDNLNISEDVIDCVTNINGYNEDTLNDILYYYTSYESLEQYTEPEDINTYDLYYKGGDNK